MKVKEWYTVNEVAEILGVSGETVRNNIKRGLFPNTRKKSPMLGSAYMITMVDLNDYLRAAHGRQE